ncbi:mCG62349 [Mus musculus]|nr:mCG62349 [Mus musculus]
MVLYKPEELALQMGESRKKREASHRHLEIGDKGEKEGGLESKKEPEVELSATSPAPCLPACHHASLPGNNGLNLRNRETSLAADPRK